MVKPKKVKVIGCGGIGTMLLQPLCCYLEYTLPKTCVTLVDGDTYEPRNKARQVFEKLGEKAPVTAKRLAKQHGGLVFASKNSYVSEDNVTDIIEEHDIVFLCVDNHATRKLVSDHAASLENVIVISGGNDWTDGNVLSYVRRENKDLTPSLTKYNKDISNPTDKIPKKVIANMDGCQKKIPSSPQLVVTNNQIAARMLSVFYSLTQGNLIPEVYEDIVTCSARASKRIV